MARWVAVHDRRTGTYLELHDGPEDETPRTRERGVLTSRNANLKKTIGAEVAPDLSHLESASLELQLSEDMPFDDCGRLRGTRSMACPAGQGGRRATKRKSLKSCSATQSAPARGI